MMLFLNTSKINQYLPEFRKSKKDREYNYLKMRERYGEKLTKNSFLIREQFDVRDPFKISNCKEVKAKTLSRKLSPSNSNLTVTDPVSEPSTADNRDLDCSDFDKTNFKVQPGDPFNLDPDGDGIACES
ncbi:MAG: excalibur calcium-binding domain-containing protein [Nitrososphaeraceae archaeon]